jgi:hypothetical protein
MAKIQNFDKEKSLYAKKVSFLRMVEHRGREHK